MATIYKVLGQRESAVTTEENLYTVPSATQAVCSTLSVCNRAATATTFRVRIRVNGAATDDKQFVCYNAPIAGEDTLLLTFGATLNAGDLVDVYSTSGNVTFQLFGSEIS